MLDISSIGARVSTEAYMPFPDEVTVELRSGGRWLSKRRWQLGMETGFEFVRFAGLHAAATADASLLYDKLRNAGARDVTERLAAARYFDDAELQKASEAAEAALMELEQALRVASGRS